MTIETVVNGGSAVGHSVHGSSVYISVIQDQNGPPPPAPGASVDALENSRVFRGAGLGIHVVVAGPANRFESLTRLDVLDGELGVLRDHLGHIVFKPVQRFGRVFLGFILHVGGAVALGRRRRSAAEQNTDGGCTCNAVCLHRALLLQVLDSGLGAFTVTAVDHAIVVAQHFKRLLQLHNVCSAVADAGRLGGRTNLLDTGNRGIGFAGRRFGSGLCTGRGGRSL
jgi:hypothetical protein